MKNKFNEYEDYLREFQKNINEKKLLGFDDLSETDFRIRFYDVFDKFAFSYPKEFIKITYFLFKKKYIDEKVCKIAVKRILNKFPEFYTFTNNPTSITGE